MRDVVVVKEIKLRPRTDDHDVEFKTKNIKRFLEEGNKVICKKTHVGLENLTPWERLVYCLWVADYGMRNAGDLNAALEMTVDDAQLAAADAAATELDDYFSALIELRRADPRDDLISILIAETDGEARRLDRRELLANLVLLLVAGFETTTNLLGNALAVLFDHPELRAGLPTGTEGQGKDVVDRLGHSELRCRTERRTRGAGENGRGNRSSSERGAGSAVRQPNAAGELARQSGFTVVSLSHNVLNGAPSCNES
jgi:hypothetical protein